MKRIKLFEKLFYIIFLIGLLAYEVHIYSYFKYIQAILFSLSFLSLLVLIKSKYYRNKLIINLNKNKLPAILSFLMVISTCFSNYLYYYNSPITIFIAIMFSVNILLYFYLLPIYLEENSEFKNNIYIFISRIIITIIILGIIIAFKKGFMGYELEYNRARSIYFDPNFFATISIIPFLLYLRKNNHIFIKVLLLLLCIAVIFLSGSRGTMLSLALCIFYYIFIKYPNKHYIKKTIILLLFMLGSIYIYNYLSSIDFLRLYQGSGGRFEMIKFSFDIIKKSPIFGFGYGSIDILLKNNGYVNASTHNSLVDFMIGYGIPCFTLYMIVIIKTIKKGLKRDAQLYSNLIFIFLLSNMNTILFSFGGVGFPSIILTLFMGILNYEGGQRL